MLPCIKSLLAVVQIRRGPPFLFVYVCIISIKVTQHTVVHHIGPAEYFPAKSSNE